MQVYIELAFIENFCMDFVLLYSAKLVSKNTCALWRIVLGAVLGAVFAVVFPLLKANAVWSVVLKLLSGLLICLVACKKHYLKFCLWFLLFTFVLGGALIGLYALTGWEYEEGGGFLLSSVPVGIPLFCALLLFLGAKRLAKVFIKGSKNAVKCRIYAGQSQIEIGGFYDSGNKVYLAGEPVSIIPESSAQKLIDVESIKDGVKIHTVAGSKILKVFTADRMEISFNGKTNIIKKAKIGVSGQNIASAVIHPDLMED